jgi:serine/threonine-protein kinase ULK4
MEDYQLYEPIATGKSATIYKARKRRTLQYVAVKRVGKEELPRIRNSIAALYALRHPNVLGFVNWYATSKHVWTVTEYCAGGDLSSVITTDGCLPPESVRLFAADVVAGLSHVHARGFLMAELRPGGVLLDENGSLKLANFTFAQRIDDDMLPAKSKTTATALQYTPPELLLLNPETLPASLLSNNISDIEDLYGGSSARMSAVFSRAADLYALGVLIFEMALGVRPFGEPSAQQAICSIITQDAWAGTTQPAFSALESSCPPLAHLIRGLLHKDPLRRFGWPQLISHPFWCGNTSSLAGPPLVSLPSNDEIHRFDVEPHFSEYIAQRAAAGNLTAIISAAPTSPLAECDMSSITNANATVLGIVSTPTKREMLFPAKQVASTAQPAAAGYNGGSVATSHDPPDFVAHETVFDEEPATTGSARPGDKIIQSAIPDLTELAVPHDDSAYTYADSLLAADMAALALNASSVSNTEEATEWRAVPAARIADYSVAGPEGGGDDGKPSERLRGAAKHFHTVRD